MSHSHGHTGWPRVVAAFRAVTVTPSTIRHKMPQGAVIGYTSLCLLLSLVSAVDGTAGTVALLVRSRLETASVSATNANSHVAAGATGQSDAALTAQNRRSEGKVDQPKLRVFLIPHSHCDTSRPMHVTCCIFLAKIVLSPSNHAT